MPRWSLTCLQKVASDILRAHSTTSSPSRVPSIILTENSTGKIWIARYARIVSQSPDLRAEIKSSIRCNAVMERLQAMQRCRITTSLDVWDPDSLRSWMMHWKNTACSCAMEAHSMQHECALHTFTTFGRNLSSLRNLREQANLFLPNLHFRQVSSFSLEAPWGNFRHLVSERI